jgi:hypothetical protein
LFHTLVLYSVFRINLRIFLSIHGNLVENGSVFIFGEKGIDKLVGAININYNFFSFYASACDD